MSIAPADISVTCSVSGCPTGLGNRVTVSVVGHFQLLTPILAPFFGGTQNVTFTRSSTSQIETLPVPSTPASTATPTPTPTPTAHPDGRADRDPGRDAHADPGRDRDAHADPQLLAAERRLHVRHLAQEQPVAGHA